MTETRAAVYSLGRRLTWLFALQTLVGLGTLSVGIYAVTARSLSERANAELARKVELVKHLVREASTGGEAAMRHKLDEFFMSHEDMQVTLYSLVGEVTYQSPGRVPATAAQRVVTLELGGAEVLPRFVRASFKLDRDEDANLLAGLAAILVVATIVGAVALSLSGAWMVRGSLKPLRGLAEQMRSLRAGQFHKRLALSPRVEELQPWIEQFNELLGRLEASYQQLESFNADVAHELRTPLTTLIGQTELALTRQRSPEELRDTLGSNLEEIQRVSSIVNDMLFLARADGGARARFTASAPLRPQIQQAVDFHDGELSEQDLVVDIQGNATASFEAGLVRRAASNLLSNATRYALPGSAITIRLSESHGFAWVEVSNQGQEIPADALPRLFERFFRADTYREASDHNHGLGLAIVAAIARMHGGSARAASNGGQTTISFSLSLPDSERAGHV